MSTATNDITGDNIKSRPNSRDYRDNYDKIFYRSETHVQGTTGSPKPSSGVRVPDGLPNKETTPLKKFIGDMLNKRMSLDVGYDVTKK